MQKYFETPKYKLIYVFRINDKEHKGCLKIGETTIGEDVADVFKLKPNAKVLNHYARTRIDQYTQTAGTAYDLLHTETAVYKKGKDIVCFNDKDVHSVLLRSGIKRKTFRGVVKQGKEWFITDLETAKNAIKAVKEGRKSLSAKEVSQKKSPIIFRPEQREAIEKTKKQFKKSNQMLWNAKMRFGKTLSALQVVKEMAFNRTLILTHRPVVNEGWFEDFNKIFYDTKDYVYGSKNNGESLASLKALSKNMHIIYFASMQDLRGSEAVGGKFNKNDKIFSTPWDLIIVDEAHEGTQTELGKAVMAELTKDKTKVLRLSGTPFNLLDDFKEDEIYTWDYVMEQRAKRDWDLTHFGDPNPYAELPRLSIYTYDLGRLLSQYIEADIAFNFREFFRVDEEGEFIHKNDINSFLNLLTKTDEESCYPFSNDTYREIFRHTLWVLPGVKAAKALSAMLQSHDVFSSFKIVNVAGDGDEDEENSEALSMVNSAIGAHPEDTRTITLSCGRLTTGVTVKAWTGVLMLSGSYNTAASAYMQTIFRVQSPATINGRVKEDCYVFDFAPDRTLQVLATVPRVSTKAGQTTENQKRALGEFLNFCPVISVEGSKMTPMNVTRMLQHLKRAYIEKVVRSGFEDGHLYNDELLKLSDIDIQEFDKLKGIIGKTKAIGNAGNIDVNAQGLTHEEYEEKKDLEKKKKKDLTEEEKKRLEELRGKNKLRNDAISILRGISIRMPLLIYGAEIADESKELTIDNFTALVDNQSWEEFMPRGVTKETFNNFKRYYDPEIFSAAGRRIRALAREADKMMPEERIERIVSIFSTFRNPDKETVLTPWRVVNMHMGDTLGGYCFYNKTYSEELTEPRYIIQKGVTRKVFASDTYLMEINSKSGLYPLYLAYNVYRSRMKEATYSPETLKENLYLWDEAVAKNIFVICKTPMAERITRRTLVGFRKAKVNAKYVDNLVERIKTEPNKFAKEVVKGHKFWKTNNNDDMKFNAVVGNPPYQEEGISTRKYPIYHLFYDLANKLSEKVTLITPGRFLFHVGQTPEEWMDKVLNDKHFKVVDYFSKSTDVFPTVDIKGGVAITLRDAKQDFGSIGFFSEHNELKTILQKVRVHKDFLQDEFCNIVTQDGVYKFTKSFFTDYPQATEVQGKGSGAVITSNALENLPEAFLIDKPDDGEYYIQILGRVDNQRATRWIKRKYVREVKSLELFKVFVTKSNGTGAFGEALSTPIIGHPYVGHTQTFISIGKFEKKAEAEACLKYIKTKFARTMLGTLKATQHNSRDTWANVPLQDFTSNSDIDWTQSVSDIDKQLYKKYGLTQEEQQFIETMIKPM